MAIVINLKQGSFNNELCRKLLHLCWGRGFGVESFSVEFTPHNGSRMFN